MSTDGEVSIAVTGDARAFEEAIKKVDTSSAKAGKAAAKNLEPVSTELEVGKLAAEGFGGSIGALVTPFEKFWKAGSLVAGPAGGAIGVGFAALSAEAALFATAVVGAVTGLIAVGDAAAESLASLREIRDFNELEFVSQDAIDRVEETSKQLGDMRIAADVAAVSLGSGLAPIINDVTGLLTSGLLAAGRYAEAMGRIREATEAVNLPLQALRYVSARFADDTIDLATDTAAARREQEEMAAALGLTATANEIAADATARNRAEKEADAEASKADAAAKRAAADAARILADATRANAAAAKIERDAVFALASDEEKLAMSYRETLQSLEDLSDAGADQETVIRAQTAATNEYRAALAALASDTEPLIDVDGLTEDLTEVHDKLAELNEEISSSIKELLGGIRDTLLALGDSFLDLGITIAEISQERREDVVDNAAAAIEAERENIKILKEEQAIAAEEMEAAGISSEAAAESRAEEKARADDERRAFALSAESEAINALDELMKQAATKEDERSIQRQINEAKARIETAKSVKEDQEQAAKRAFRTGQALQVAAVTPQAVMYGLGVATFLAPFSGPAAIVAGVAAGAAAAGSSIASIMAAKPPEFAGGGMVGDHMLIAAQRDEGILTPRGVRTAGGPGGLDALNRGIAPAASQPVQVMLDRRMLAEASAGTTRRTRYPVGRAPGHGGL